MVECVGARGCYAKGGVVSDMWLAVNIRDGFLVPVTRRTEYGVLLGKSSAEEVRGEIEEDGNRKAQRVDKKRSEACEIWIDWMS